MQAKMKSCSVNKWWKLTIVFIVMNIGSDCTGIGILSMLGFNFNIPKVPPRLYPLDIYTTEEPAVLYTTQSKTTTVNIGDFNQNSPEQMVRKFFQYFKQEEPRGVPVLNLPFRLKLEGPLVTYAMTMTNYTMIGHTFGKLEYFFLNVTDLSANITIDLPKIEVEGDYVMPGLWANSEGYLDLLMEGVTVHISVGIDFNDSSVALFLSDLEMDLINKYVDFNMTGLVFEHQMLVDSGAIHTFFRPLFYQMFQVCEPWFLFLINEELGRCFEQLPDSPFDDSNYDSKLSAFLNFVLSRAKLNPLNVPDKRYKAMGLDIFTTEVQLFGLPDIEKIHELTLEYKNKRVFVNMEITMKHLFLRFNYRVVKRALLINYSKTVKVDISRPCFVVKFEVDPSLVTPPQLVYLDLKTDGLKVHTKGKGFFGPLKQALSYLIDKNRNGILGRIKAPLKKNIQDNLNNLDIEGAIVKMLRKKNQKG